MIDKKFIIRQNLKRKTNTKKRGKHMIKQVSNKTLGRVHTNLINKKVIKRDNIIMLCG